MIYRIGKLYISQFRLRVFPTLDYFSAGPTLTLAQEDILWDKSILEPENQPFMVTEITSVKHYVNIVHVLFPYSMGWLWTNGDYEEFRPHHFI